VHVGAGSSTQVEAVVVVVVVSCRDVCACRRWVVNTSGGGDGGHTAACVHAGAGVVTLIVVVVVAPQSVCMHAGAGAVTVNGNGGGHVTTCMWAGAGLLTPVVIVVVLHRACVVALGSLLLVVVVVTACGCWVVDASGCGGHGHVTACRHGGRRWVVVVASCGHGRGRVAMCVRTDTGVITVIVDAGDGMVAVDEWQ